MSATSLAAPPRRVTTVPVRQVIPGVLRGPLQMVEEIGRRSGGDLTRLNLGTFRPYLVSRPEHIQHILRDNAAKYRREGLLWKPLSRLVGAPSGADPAWPLKKDAYFALLTAPKVASYTEDMATAIADAVDELAERVPSGQTADASIEFTRIVYRAILRIFVGDRLPLSRADEFGAAMMTAAESSFRARLLFPYMPFWFPLPGDRAFHRAVGDIDDIILPLVQAARREESAGEDLVSTLLRARGEDGRVLSDQEVRDGIVALFLAGTETTVKALSYLWVVLDSHPEVANALFAEIDQVVGQGRPRAEHLPELRYTRMVTHELLRVFPPGWILPRIAAEDDVLDGIRIKAGSIVVISPYLTHRSEAHWPDPLTFDPERFAPERADRRHRFAYLPFGAGPHQCAGSLFFSVESQLIIASMVSRLRPELGNAGAVGVAADLTMRPSEPVALKLNPTRR
ncbi:cytochrome P450 [Actinomadura rugatobispora]|uniref:Cytochrome P450 n=1 Tax=Actinomadura rugatobispora TaxID=1994 RepID=A0ABW1AAG4_9ACTN|nr:cytochrome P450 [Actinomadura rugatobispora]